jgi:hypothetical protein
MVIRFLGLLIFLSSALGVAGQDTLPPKITLKGIPAVTVCKYHTYRDEGYNLNDDNSITEIQITTEGTFKNTNSLGLFSLKYKATDKAGNTAYSEWRYILVVCEDGLCTPCYISVPEISLIENIRYNVAVSGTSVFIKFTTDISPTFRVWDITGKPVDISIRQSSLLEWEVFLDNVPKGMYIFSAEAGGIRSSRKIVIR